MIGLFAFFLLSAAVSTNAQTTCANYGNVNGSSCVCPPGFGGTTCSEPACGGDIFQGAQRTLAQPASGSSLSNLTASGCTCESGWTGTGCNVCQSASACQAASSASGQNQSTSTGLTDSQDGQNNTLTCSTTPRVWAAGQMSCQVIVSVVSFSIRLRLTDITEPDFASYIPAFLNPEHPPYPSACFDTDTECYRVWNQRLGPCATLVRRCGAVLLQSGFMHAGSEWWERGGGLELPGPCVYLHTGQYILWRIGEHVTPLDVPSSKTALRRLQI